MVCITHVANICAYGLCHSSKQLCVIYMANVWDRLTCGIARGQRGVVPYAYIFGGVRDSNIAKYMQGLAS